MNRNLSCFVKAWMPVIAWMALIFLGSTDVLSAEHTSRFIFPILRWLDPHMSWATMYSIQIVVRKVGHLTEYGILAALLWRALRSGMRWSFQTSILFAIVCVTCALFAASDEFHQSFVPSRTSSIHDVMIDICGALIGLAICVALASRKAVKEKACSTID